MQEEKYFELQSNVCINSEILEKLRGNYLSPINKEDVLGDISRIFAEYIMANDLAYLFKDISYNLKWRIDMKLDCSASLIYYLCCCCCGENSEEELLQFYDFNIQETTSNYYYNYPSTRIKFHWMLLKFWRLENLMQILGCEKKYKPSTVKVGFDDAETGFDKYIIDILRMDLVRIQLCTYNILKFEYSVV